jgi:CheY-like chemotaxis protein
VQQKDTMVEIDVFDEGVGLSPHELETIFIPFHQLEQGERSTKGLGVGLALVRSFTLMHGGSVTAASSGSGLGSRFAVSLPLFRHETLPRKRRDTLALVVDDNDAESGSIGRLLELGGCSVIYAYHGRQAIEQASSLLPDIVLINVDLPKQEGYTIAKTLRERGFEGHFIALTESRAKSPEEADTNDMFEHHLLKPVGLPDLKRVLSELIDLAE